MGIPIWSSIGTSWAAAIIAALIAGASDGGRRQFTGRRGSAAVHRIGEEHIAGHRAEKSRSGIDVENAADDDRARSVDRTAMGGNAVHRGMFAFGVDVPHDAAVL